LRELLFFQSERYRRVSVPLDRAKRDLVSEHRRIAEAAVSRDVERATAATRDHLEKTTRILIMSAVVKAHES
jgi:DNA-binding GntR family transcriptional regulator